MDITEFRQRIGSFVRDLGHQLRTIVFIRKDRLGNDLIFPTTIRSDIPELQDPMFTKKHNVAFTEQSGVIVYVEIDNRKCSGVAGAECFQSAQDAAQFLGAVASKHTMSRSFPIVQVRGLSTMDNEVDPRPANGKYVAIGLILVIMVCTTMGVLVTAKRKRAYGKTWLPEGFTLAPRTGTRRGPDGQEMRNLNKNSSLACIADMHMTSGHSQQWSDDESAPKRSRMCEIGYNSDHTTVTEYEEATPREWTQLHYEASSMQLPSSIMTPPTHHEKADVNARGPDGWTPLMVAIRSGQPNDAVDDTDLRDEHTVQAISDLLAQGADLNAATENAGETSLHLAARFVRADAAKRLIDAGADVNCQDFTGRTPLHTAVAADARGVFQILLRNRATNLNARTHDGVTPLILAARLAPEGMVEDLINADADINAADNCGKTALHWAAVVNNVDAVNILLMHHANRDAQSDKDETPLFLAAREGCFDAAKSLLDNFANREISDHMDRSPRDVASERQHSDIVRLLDEHVARTPQMMPTVSSSTIVTSPSCHSSQMIQQPTVISASKQTKQKKRQKTAAANDNDATASTLKRKPSTKKTTTTATTTAAKKSNSIQQALPDIQLSSDGALSSVESPIASMPSPYDTASLYSNAIVAHHGLEVIPNKQPPSYEDCIKVSSKFFYYSN